MINDLFVNFCVLCTTTFLVGWTLRTLAHSQLWSLLLLRTVLTVASSFILILNAVPLREDLMLDLRAIPVALATIGGGVPAGVSVALPLLAYSLWQGGVPGLGQTLHLALVVGLFALLKRRRGANRTPVTFGVAWWEPLAVFAVADLPLALGPFLTTSAPVFEGQVFLLLITVQALGMLAAQAIVLTQLRALEHVDTLKGLAYTDALTGVGNRRALDDALDGAPTRPGEAAYLLLLDLDHFKNVNDTCGHDGGDRVLSATADVLREALGPRGQVYRFGGEEFAVLLSGRSAAEAQATAQRLRRRVTQDVGTRAGRPSLTVTVSGGLVPVAPVVTALERADALLYQAKRRGRDRVEVEGLDVGELEAGAALARVP